MDAPAVFVVTRCMQAGENDIIVNDYDKSSKSSYIGVGFSNSSVIDLLSCRQTALIGCLRAALNSVTILSRSGTASQAAPVSMRFV